MSGGKSGIRYFSRYLQSSYVGLMEDEKAHPAMYDTMPSLQIQEHHHQSYTYSIELETALANAIVESASLFSNSDIIKGQPD